MEMIALVKWVHFWPCILIVLDLVAAARYGVAKDWGRAGYWICAAGITTCATFFMGDRS